MGIDVQDDKILRFAEKHWKDSKQKRARRWNGRQIKNAVQTAVALAKWDFNDRERIGGGSESTDLEKPRLGEKHFQIVASTSAHFDDYLTTVYGINDDEDVYGALAERGEYRKDNVPGMASREYSGQRKASSLSVSYSSQRGGSSR